MNRRIMSKVCSVCMLTGILIGGAGCGSTGNGIINESNTQVQNTNEPTIQENSFSAKDAIKIEDIDWTVSDSILDGERFVGFSYTNNSKYTILDIEMEFVQKENTTAEQLAVFDTLKTDREWTDEEVQEIYILGYNRKCVDPVETAAESPCVINGTYTLVENMEQYELMEPEMVSIAFIGDDGKGYALYYDYKTQAYGESSAGPKDLHEWSTSDISSLLPKADYRAVEVTSDEKDSFRFRAYGVSQEEYEEYVEEVKNKGFAEVGFDSDTTYRATNEDGFEASISYNAMDEEMSGNVQKE